MHRKTGPFLVNERTIQKTLGLEKTPPPIRLFDLDEIGIDREAFIEYMAPTFSVLHLDPYDAKRAKIEFLKVRFPEATDRLNIFLIDYYADKADLISLYDLIVKLSEVDRNEFDRLGMFGRRKRSIARFILDRHSKPDWEIKKVPARNFEQRVSKDDPRSLVRHFHETSDLVLRHPSIDHLIRYFGDMVLEIDPSAYMLGVNLHQMFIFADLMASGDNSPEGIHQDGADYIVSALVVERAGITGGQSIVYGPDKSTKYLEYTLKPGEGIFQADKDKLWHYVTPIKEDPSVPPDYGHRSIFGLDIDVLARE